MARNLIYTLQRIDSSSTLSWYVLSTLQQPLHDFLECKWILYVFIKHAAYILCESRRKPQLFPSCSSEAASAALPALTMLAEDAEAKYGDNRKWPGQLSGGAE